MTDRQTDRGIQLLRIIACIAVFICHFGQRLQLNTISNALYELTQLGKYGVELFFVISGYLACLSFCREKSVIRFYKKRIIRILPLYYFCILYYFVTETFIFKNIPADPIHLGWLRYIFCLNGVVPPEGYFWSNIGITWTIPVFMMFFLLAPWIIKIAKSTLISLLMTLFAFGVACIVISKLNGWFSSFIYLPCFLLGILVYNAKKENARLYIAVGLQLFVIAMKYCNWSEYFPSISQKIDIWIISAIFATIILVSDELKIQHSKIIRCINFLDEHSYPLYLIHGLTFCGIIDKLTADLFNNHIIEVVLKVAIAIVGTGVLTVVLHRYIEKPTQKLLNKILLKQ